MAGRSSFIVSKGFRNYFIYSMLFTVLEQVCAVVDMIMVGNFVNATAFSALNLVVPVESIATGLIMIFTGGAGVIASRQIGNHDFDGANRTLSMSILSSIAIVLVCAVGGLYSIDGIVSLLCPENALSVYLKEYLGLYFISLVPLALYNAMIMVLNIDGKLDVVLATVVSAFALDVVLDVVFMKHMGMGVKGTALAAVISYTAPVLFMMSYAASRKCSFKFIVSGAGSLKEYLTENIKAGLPYCSPYIILCVITYIVNTIVLTNLGPYALYIWGAGYQILSILIVAMDCVGGKILVIMGGMLAGCHDMDGFRIVTKGCIKVSSALVGVILLLVFAFPRAALSLFGYDLPKDAGQELQWACCIVSLGVPYALCCIKIYISQALGRRWLSTIPLAIFFILTVGLFWGVSMLYPGFIFNSFVISGVAFILLDLLASNILGKRLGVSRYLLIPEQDNVRSLCISVAYTREGLNKALMELETFFEESEIPMALASSVNLCCEELMLSIVENNEGKKTGEEWFFDVFVIDDSDGEVKITIRDAGAPFNPVRTFGDSTADALAAGDDMDLSLRLVNNICKELSYNYMYGQNTIYMSFQK